ncbi:MAG: HAD hydrolase-like protein [Desulfurococcaceae archaeon]
MRIEMIILDYDLTIVNNYVDFYETYCNALRYYGVDPPSFDEFVKMIENNTLSSKIPRNIDEQEFWKYFRKIYISRHSWLRRGFIEFALLLRNMGAKFIVISGRETSPEYIWLDLRRLGIDHLIDDVITMSMLQEINGHEDFPFDKSSLIEYAMQKHGIIMNNIICIGDYITDYYSCVKKGLIFIGINDIEKRNQVLRESGVKIISRDFMELLPIILDLVREQ